MKRLYNLQNNIHLIISVLIVVPVAFVYGFQPDLKFDIHLNTIDEHNLFKAIMGMYLGFSALWIIGILKTNFWKLATITNIIFMLGMGFGRVFSIFLDGIPTDDYIFGTVAEILLGFYGVWIYNSKIVSSSDF